MAYEHNEVQQHRTMCHRPDDMRHCMKDTGYVWDSLCGVGLLQFSACKSDVNPGYRDPQGKLEDNVLDWQNIENKPEHHGCSYGLSYHSRSCQQLKVFSYHAKEILALRSHTDRQQGSI